MTTLLDVEEAMGKAEVASGDRHTDLPAAAAAAAAAAEEEREREKKKTG